MGGSSALELNRIKSEGRNLINVALLGICFTIFTFIITIKPQLLKENIFLGLQLVCSIPFIMSSILARLKLGYTKKAERFDILGFVSYLLGYAFLINVIGILLISFISLIAGLIFFLVNFLSAITYSIIEVSYDKKLLKQRIIKDLSFFALLVLLGILPSVYSIHQIL